MSSRDSPVVIEEDKVLLPSGRGGRKSTDEGKDLYVGRTRSIEDTIESEREQVENKDRGRKTNKKSNQETIMREKEERYSIDLRSRFGEAFLPYASQLESVRKTQTVRKRKGKNKRKQPTRITKIPKYNNDNIDKKEQYDKQCKKNMRKLKEKAGEIKTNTKEQDKLEWNGDIMTFDEEWPNVDKRRTLRIFHINLNGVTYQNDYLEWEMTLAFLMDMQVDIFGLTEINLDLNNGMVKDNVIQRGKHFDNYMQMATSSSRQTVGKSPFKMGGTITGTNGCWSGRINEQGSDGLGRWSYQKLQAKRGKQVIIITVYLPRKPTTEGGESTIYRQMELDLLTTKGKLLDPREELLKDLYTVIKLEHNKGNTVLLMGDMNDNLAMEQGQVRNFLASLEMTMTHITRHGEEVVLPATHDRGSNCIDLIGCSDHINETAIIRAGYAPFYFNFFTDHRGTFVDLDIETLFNCNRPDTTRPIYKRFTTFHVPKCARYLKKLEELMEGSKIFKKVDKLEQQFIQNAKGKPGPSKDDIINETKVLFKKVTEFMICAEKRAGPIPYKDGFPDSPSLRKAAFRVIRIKKYLRLVSLGTINADESEIKEVSNDLKSAQLSLRDTQKHSIELRQEHMEKLADKRCHQWQMTSAEAIHIINESEKSRIMHGRHRRLLKKNNDGTLRSLLIPAPITGLVNNEKDPRLYTSITDSSTMFNILLKRNYKHLIQSNESMFTKGPLLDMVGWYGNEEGMETILSGLLDYENIGKEYPQYGEEGIEFLKALQYKKNKKGKVETFTWKFGVDEYLQVFNKTRETTACGPSGLHMSHWKAACERPGIARVHAFFMWAAFEMGFTYERWENSWHCMIKKLKQPLLPKLRIVQLFEGDFNAGLKYLIGKKMMEHMNESDQHDPETFGSRTGKTAPEALINLQLLFDHNRIWNLPTAILFNDAIGCYDRIVPTICDLAMRARGCPKGIAQCHTLTQKGMKHRIRIATGVSEGLIKFNINDKQTMKGNQLLSIQGRTGGIGQGGGAGPIAWIAVIDIMLEAYRKLCPGALAVDPFLLYTICYWLISYVDDNTIVIGFQDGTTRKDILDTLTSNLRSWRNLLQLTGGDIDVEKSKWCVMKWSYSNTWGIPKIEKEKEFQGKVGMITDKGGMISQQYLGRLEPNQADRVLGVRLPLDGNMGVEYKFRCKQIRDFSEKVYNAPLTHRDAWIIYESRYRAIIRYPLPVSMFSRKQCDTIQKPFIHAILPKMGINRHTPRAVIYGPTSLGGLNLMDLRIEQVTIQWETTRGHLRRLDRAGKGIHITANDMQVETGSSIPFYNLDPEICNYVAKATRWRYLWETTAKMGLHIRMYNSWTPKPINDQDRNIMDAAMQDKELKKSKWPMLYHINRCRLYTGSIFISDLTKDGTNIHLPYLNGTERGMNKYVTIPEIRCPSNSQWKVWKSFIFRTFLSPGTKINPPLGGTRRMRNKPSLPVSETSKLLQLPVEGLCFREVISRVPDNLKPMVGTVAIPNDGGEAIGEAIVDGNCIGASDGSLIRTYERTRGSHGYALRDKRDGKQQLEGWGPSPDSDDMSSMTTEHYGLIGLLVILHIICKKFKLCKDECFDEVTIYIDNKTVIARGDERQNLINLSDYSVPNQDLWQLTTELMDAMPIVIKLKWVRGHQDTNIYGDRIHGPFIPAVQMNIQVDELANRGLTMGANSILRKELLSTETISLYNEKGVQITNLRHYMKVRINGKELVDYMKKRKGWTSEDVSTIEWEGVEAMLKNASSPVKAQLIKLLHNWQNTGRQKGKFRDSRLKLDSDEPLIPTEEEIHCHECPDGCNEEETDLHYLDCQAPHAKIRRKKCIQKVLRRLKNLITYEGITSTIGYILTQISNKEDISFDWEEQHRDGDMALTIAIQGQQRIGWNCLCQGFYHKEWARIQQRHYQRLGKKSRSLNITRWKKMFSTIMAEYSLECWKMRNESIHGKENGDSRLLRKEKIGKLIKGLYGKKKELNKKMRRRVFSMPLEKRLRMGIQSSTIWVKLAEEVLRRHRDNLSKNTLHHWLQP